MKKKKHLISVIIPVFKNVNYLKNSLKSVINQTYKNIEILVINDGNAPKDVKEIKDIIFLFKKKIKLLSIKKNNGVSNALNLGIKKSKGEYIAWLSHDDFFLKNKLKKQISLMIKKNYHISSCDFYTSNHNKLKKKSLPHDYYRDFKTSLFLFDKLHGCSLLIKKSCFRDHGYFNIKLKHAQDYDMWLRLANRYDIFHINEPLLVSQVHYGQNSILFKDEAKLEKQFFYCQYLKKNQNILNDLNIKKIFIFFIFNIYRKFYLLNKIFLEKIILKRKNKFLYKILYFINNQFI